MLYAAIDIHKHAFQAAVLDAVIGEVVEERFSADRESLARWAEEWRGRVGAVAIEATRGWRWVWRELVSHGFEVSLAEPVQARGLLGRRRSAKTDRLDARWLARLLAKEMLPESWIPPGEIQRLRDRTRRRKALAEDRRRWGQRLHTFLFHEGWPCSKAGLLTPEGLRWAAALKLPEHARLQVDSLLAVIAAVEVQLDMVDAELRRFARADDRCRGLQAIYGIGPILACHVLAEIGEARRFRRAEQITRLAGLDPVVDESGETRRRGKLAKAGSPHLHWALVEAAVHVNRQSAPDVAVYRATRERREATVVRLTVARKIGKRIYLALRGSSSRPLDISALTPSLLDLSRRSSTPEVE
jgi:transposase